MSEAPNWPEPLPTPGTVRTTRDECRAFLRWAVEGHGCRAASAWALDPVRRRLILIDVQGIPAELTTNRSLDCATNLTGTTVERKQVTIIHDLCQPDEHGRSFSHPELVSRFELRAMVSIPVLNTSNPNQVLLVVNLFPGPGRSLAELQADPLLSWGRVLAGRVEAALRERCERAANRVGIEVGWGAKKPTSGRLAAALTRVACRAVGCDRVVVYLEQVRGREMVLLPVGEPGSDAPPAAWGQLAEACWRANRERFAADRPGEPSLLAVPLRDADGQAKGVACCAYLAADPAAVPRQFTYDDVAVVESAGQAFSARLSVLMAELRRAASLDRLVHEMRVPLVALRAVLERIKKECRRSAVRFDYDHFQEVDTYVDLMRWQLSELDLTRPFAPRLVLQAKWVALEPAIFAPAKRFAADLLEKYGFRREQVRFDGLEGVRLWVDVVRMTQLVFNLLENAAKYSDPATPFRLDIAAWWEEGGFVIAFRDAGSGVPAGYEERIFQYGERGPGAHLSDVVGDGIGLWLAREVARAHGGDLRYRRPAAGENYVTEFLLTLPAELLDGPPSPHQETPNE